MSNMREQKAFEEMQEKQRLFVEKELAENCLGLKVPEIEHLSENKRKEVVREAESEQLKKRIMDFKKKILVENGLVDEETRLAVMVQYANLVENKLFKQNQLRTKHIIEKNERLSGEGAVKQEWQLRQELRIINAELIKAVKDAASWGVSKEELDGYVQESVI